MKKLIGVTLLASTLVAGAAFATDRQENNTCTVSAFQNMGVTLDTDLSSATVYFTKGAATSGKLVYTAALSSSSYNKSVENALKKLNACGDNDKWTKTGTPGVNAIFTNGSTGEVVNATLAQNKMSVAWTVTQGTPVNVH